MKSEEQKERERKQRQQQAIDAILNGGKAQKSRSAGSDAALVEHALSAYRRGDISVGAIHRSRQNSREASKNRPQQLIGTQTDFRPEVKRALRAVHDPLGKNRVDPFEVLKKAGAFGKPSTQEQKTLPEELDRGVSQLISDNAARRASNPSVPARLAGIANEHLAGKGVEIRPNQSFAKVSRALDEETKSANAALRLAAYAKQDQERGRATPTLYPAAYETAQDRVSRYETAVENAQRYMQTVPSLSEADARLRAAQGKNETGEALQEARAQYALALQLYEKQRGKNEAVPTALDAMKRDETAQRTLSDIPKEISDWETILNGAGTSDAEKREAEQEIARLKAALPNAQQEAETAHEEALYATQKYYSALNALRQNEDWAAVQKSSRLIPSPKDMGLVLKTPDGETEVPIPGGGNTLSLLQNQLTKDERETLTYLAATQGQAAAEEYIEFMLPQLTARAGDEIADRWDYPVLREAFGVFSGVSGAGKNLAQLFQSDARAYDEMDAANEAMLERSSNFQKPFYQAAYAAGNMLPSVATSYLTAGILNSAWAAAAGSGMTALASAGGAYTQALNAGMDPDQARIYSALIGASEAGLQYVLGGISSLGGISKLTERRVAAIVNPVARTAARLGVSAFGEVAEENIQNYLEPFFVKIVTGEDYEAPSWQEFLETTLTTFLLTVGLELPQDIGKAMGEQRGKKLAAQLELELKSRAETEKMYNSCVALWAQEAFASPDAEIRRAGRRLLDKIDRGETIPTEMFRRTVQGLGASEQTVQAIREGKLVAPNLDEDAMSSTARKYRQRHLNDADATVSALVGAGRIYDAQEYSNRTGIKNGAEANVGRDSTIPGAQKAQTAAAAVPGQQLHIDNAAGLEYTERNGGVLNDGNRMDRGMAEGVSERQFSGGRDAGGRQDGRTNQVLSRRAVSQSLQQAFEQSGVAAAELYDFDADSAAFSSALETARTADAAHGWAVTPQTAENLQGKHTFMDKGGTIGFAVTTDGDIEAVFKNKLLNHTRHAMDGVMPQAIAAGGVKLDCYGKDLVRIYESYGFTPVARVEFNEQYANPGWDESKGTPYIYFMAHNGDSAETVAANIGKYPHMERSQLESLPTYGKEGYDQAAAYRDGLLQSRDGTLQNRSAAVSADASTGAAPLGFDPYSHALNEYGAIEPGENPARVVDVPKSVDGETRVMRGVRTAMEAEVTGQSMLPRIEQEVLNGLFNRKKGSNQQRRQAAERWLSARNPQSAVSEWLGRSQGRVTPDHVAQGALLYGELCKLAEDMTIPDRERAGYRDSAISVLSELSGETAQMGDALQISRLLKQLSPADQVLLLRNSVEKINEGLNERNPQGTRRRERAEERAARRRSREGAETDIDTLRGNLNEALGDSANIVQINETLLGNWFDALAANDAEKIDTAKSALYQDIARQVPKTFRERWNAWRYLSMLGNPRTVLRNLGGNLSMVVNKLGADKMAAVLERTIAKENRTKTIGPLYATKEGRAMLDFVKETYYPEVREALKGEGKYSDKSDANTVEKELRNAIREENGKFELPVLKQWQAATDWAMNESFFGDEGFLKHHFSETFAQAARAKGWTVEDIQSGKIAKEQIDAVKNYAILQAQRATFRDLNAFSAAAKKLRLDGNTPLGKALEIAIEGIVPFKSTPANVAVRAVEYSPIGLLNGFRQLAEAEIARTQWGAKLFQNAPTLSQSFQTISEGAVGTVWFLLGLMGYRAGWFTPGALDDDEEREGYQTYALNIGGKNITLDWISPTAIPLFMGVTAAQAMDSDEKSFETFLDTGLNSLQPMLEMSMLSSMSDLLENMQYAGGQGEVVGILNNFFARPFLSYLSQGVPTLFSQISQITNGTQKQTYVGDIRSANLRAIVKDLEKLVKKVPGAQQLLGLRQIDYIDEWGRDSDTGNILKRSVNALLNPAFVTTPTKTAADRELERLQKALGKDAVSQPKRAGYTISVVQEDGSTEEKRLSGEQYEKFQRAKGGMSLRLVEALLDDAVYQELPDADKAHAIQEAYTLASAAAKDALGFRLKDGAWEAELLEADEQQAATALALRALGASSTRKVFTDTEHADDRVGQEEKTLGQIQAPAEIKVGEGDDAEIHTMMPEDYEQYRDAFLEVWEAASREKMDDQALSRLRTVADAAGKAAAMEDEGLDYEKESSLEGYETVKKSGVSIDDYIAAWQEKQRISEEVDMGDRAQAFRQWMETSGRGFTSSQKKTLAEVYKFYMMAPEKQGQYGEMLDSGVSEATARKIASAVDALKPEEGKKSVTDRQKADAIIKGGYSDRDAYTAVSGYINTETAAKLDRAHDAGVNTAQFVDFWYHTDSDASGYVSKAEAIAWLKKSGLTKEQKRMLFRLRWKDGKGCPWG